MLLRNIVVALVLIRLFHLVFVDFFRAILVGREHLSNVGRWHLTQFRETKKIYQGKSDSMKMVIDHLGMSRISKWKLEKTKVKVVFRLQFHATHIPQSGWDKLFISFIPADSGKATAKTTKANVRNGTCKWADPIYETTRLLQDAKTKLYDEKPYKLIVAVGSSRSSVLGEANINLADYADASKPSAVALPLIGCNSGAVLHVTVQLLTSKTGFREFEQQRELRERGLQTSTALNSHDEVGIVKVSSSGEPLNEQIDKVNAKVRFKRDSRELPSLEEEMGVNEEYADSATGFDGSSNTSESLCAEKHDTSSTHEVESLKSRVSGDIGGVSLGQSPRQEKGDSDHPLLAQRSNDWVHGWNSDCSVDNELANAYEGNFKLRGCSEVVESSIFKMKLEVSSLQNHADEIGAEIQKFDQQLFAEIASGKELANEVSILQAECSKLKDDLEYIKALKLKSELPGEETVKTDRIQDLQDLQLGWLKGLSFLEDKIREIQNKACLGYHERDFRFLLPDLESLLDVLQNLKKKSGGMTSLVNMVPADELKNVPVHNIEKLVLETGFNMDLNQSDELFHCSTVPGLVSCESESTDTSGAMKAKIFQLLRELDESKAEQEILVRKMGQMECYYEALVQELEENQKQVLGELQNLRNEHSTCLYTISSNEAQIEAMHQDMNEQIIRLAEERHALDLLNKQLERRVVISEAALKRARLNYSIAVDQLQKDLELLSLQVVSMFETNENLIKQTYTDAWEPIVVQNQELCSGISNCFQGQNHDVPMKNQCLGGDFVMEDMKRSLHFQDELFRKVEGELSEMHLVNVHLDVFSKALQEILFEASANFGVLNERVDELAQQLELSTKSKEILIVRLQDAMEDLHSVNEFKANYIARCNDLVLQNQILEEKLKNISDEKCLLIKKVEENEALLKEIRIFESKYEACAAENADLKNLLKQETLENDDLRDKLLGLQQEMKIVEADYDKLDSVKENLQKSVNLLQDELRRLLECSGKKFREAAQGSRSLSQNLEFGDFTSAILQLEELQNDTHQRILQLMEQKKDLEDERDIARESLRTTKSENLVLRQKLQYDKQDMLSKFEAVSAIMQKLQSELEMIANKVKMASDVEAQYAKQNRDLSSGIGILEVELQQLTSRNNDLAQEILALGTVIEELERVRLTNSELSGENQSLKMSLQNKAGESARLVLELNNLKESFNLLDQKMAVERDYRDKLEGRVSDLTSQLNETHDELHHFEQQKNELARFKQMIADLKSEKAEVCHRLLHYEKCLKEVSDVSLSIGDLETQLAGMHDNLLSADIELAISKTVYTGIVKELFQRLQSFTIQSKETERKYLDAETALNCSLSKEGKYIAENEKLVSAVETLRAELEAAERKYLNAETALNCSLSREGNYIEENEKLVSAVETLRAELEATERKYLDAEKALNCSLSREGKYIEENGKLVTAVETLSAELAAERRCLDAEAALNCSLSREGKCIEENAELITAVETLRAELEAAVKKYLDAETALNCSLSKEGKYIEENEKLVTAVETLRAELEAAVTQNGALIDSNRVVTAQLEECKNREAIPLVNFSIEKQQHALEIEWLKNMLISCEEEVDSLRISNEELEITTIVFKAKLSEQHAKLSTLKQHKDDLRMLQNQCNELSCKLSEQTLKTEEYKNLSIHLKELKDKADGENLQAREKRESEGQSVTMQESLRIAFIKEQYETRVQEMKQQLSISKRHSEELLWKLQDAVNEVENRKKSEVSHLKRNEELSLKVLELEAEMQAVLSDKREKVKAYDRVKAELDCSLLSLECCKEEKQNLEISLKECNEEKFRTTTELTMVKEMLEGCGSTCNVQVEQNNGPFIAGSMSNDSIAGKVCEKCGHAVTSMCTASDPMSIYGKQENSKNYDGVNDGNLIPVSEGKHSSLLQNAQSKQLERMKNENSLLLEAYHHSDSKPQVLQRELMQLNKANEELGIMFPPFNELPESGNALERVLALEIELAEALKAKKRTNVQFQSSFLRQHGDEEAVFQSFKDINELLKDMLELKGRYSTVETELKEMHDRYSQLSLQFAEVEGERQKLMMTLKNVRASKKTLLNRSSSATLGENC
ncbi:NT-type C2 domain [Dillenia turbinata]|uniref:NT-type C2 domain n=1 Tax=Dillenia turbinata TaxID=194707 RepID=A0AAN8VYP9_9MAGN